METLKWEVVRRTYANQWVLAEVLAADEEGRPKEVRVLAHSRVRRRIYRKLQRLKGRHLCLLYTGEPPREGYAVAFP